MNNMFKRLLSGVMAVVMVMSFAVMPVSADDGDGTPETGCSHTWENGACTVEGCGMTCSHEGAELTGNTATCIEEGVKTFICGTCGMTYEESAAPLGHSYGDDNTCDVEGCGAVKSDGTADAETCEKTEEEEPSCTCAGLTECQGEACVVCTDDVEACERIVEEEPSVPTCACAGLTECKGAECPVCVVDAEKCEKTKEEEPPVLSCTCEGQTKCAEDAVKADCPICAAEGAVLEECCLGQTEEVPTVEMPKALYFSDQTATWGTEVKVVYVNAEGVETEAALSYSDCGYFYSAEVPEGTVSFYFTDGVNKTAPQTIEAVLADGTDMCVIFDGETEWMEYATWEQIDVWDGETIADKDDLLAFAAAVNKGDTFAGKTVTLTDDINLSGVDWTPIGNWNSSVFSGTFDGQGNTIKNMTIGKTDASATIRLGLFGYVKNATIKNLKIDNANISADANIARGAVLVMCADGTSNTISGITITNSSVTMKSVGQTYACGVVAWANSGTSMKMSGITVDGLELTASQTSGNAAEVAVILGYLNQADGQSSSIGNFSVEDVTIDVNANKARIGVLGDINKGNVTVTNGSKVDNLKITSTGSGEHDIGGLIGYAYKVDPLKVEEVTITNLDIDFGGTASRVGGVTGWDQSVSRATGGYKRVSVSGAIDETATSNTGSEVGGFVGISYYYPKTYTDCSADVDIKTTNRAGGFVGTPCPNNWSNQTDLYTNCAASGDVTAPVAGGFVGCAWLNNGVNSTLKLENVKATGAVTGTTHAGGLIGYAGGSGGCSNIIITGSTASTNVTGTENTTIAGVIGKADMASGKSITLNNVTSSDKLPLVNGSTGSVKVSVATVNGTGYDSLEEAVNAANTTEGGATITLLYPVEVSKTLDISGNVTIDGNGKKISTAVGFDGELFNVAGSASLSIIGGTFTQDVSQYCAPGYVAVKNENGTYSVNKWYDPEANEYTINNKAELLAFAAVANAGNNFSGKTVKLADDIDFENGEWTAVNFAGTFDGGKNTISNLTYVPNDGKYGFFNDLSGTAKDLTLDGIQATMTGGRFGGAVRLLNGTANNVHVKNITLETTSAVDFIGGFTSFAYGYATNCSVENFELTAVPSEALIAGFVGSVRSSHTFTNCDVKGFKATVAGNGDGAGVGGFTPHTQTGWNNPKFVDCDVTGIDFTVTGYVDAAGFVAAPGAHTHATNCHAEGKIDASGVTNNVASVGGFFGNLGWNADLGQMGHKVTNCSANVDIITKIAPAGGFVGSATNFNNASMYATFTNCTASGDVTCVEGGTANIGGFAGNADRGVYTNCVATGKVENKGSGYAGGFIGYFKDTKPSYDHRYPEGTRDYLTDDATLEDCTASKTVTGSEGKVGGLIGYVEAFNQRTDKVMTLTDNTYYVSPMYNTVENNEDIDSSGNGTEIEGMPGITAPEGTIVDPDTGVATLPEEGGTVGVGGTDIDLPGGSTVKDNGDSTVTIVPGNDGNEEEGNDITIDGNKVTVPENGSITVDKETGEVTLPGGSVIETEDGTKIEVPKDGTATINPDGTIEVPENTEITIPGTGTEDDVVVILPDGGTVKPGTPGTEGTDDTIEVPEGGSIIVDGNKVELPEGGTVIVNPDGTITLPNGGTVEIGGVKVEVPEGSTIDPETGTITLPETGGKVTVGDTEITLPGGSTITKGEDGSIQINPSNDTDPSTNDNKATVNGNEVTLPGNNSTIIVDKDGEVTLPGGSVIETDDGTTVTIPSDKEGTIGKDGTITAPSGSTIETPNGTEIEVGNGTATVDPTTGEIDLPAGSKVTLPGNSADTTDDVTVTLPNGGTVVPGTPGTEGTDDTIEVPKDGSIEVGGTEITFPDGGNVEIDPDTGDVTLPENSKVEIGGTVIEFPNGGEVNEDGTIEVEPGDKVIIDGTEVVLPNGGTIEPDDDGKGVVIDPADDKVIIDGTEVTLPEGGNVEIEKGGEATIPGGSTIVIPGGEGTEDDVTIKVDEDGAATIDPEGNIDLPAGSTVQKGDGDPTELPTGGTVEKDGDITVGGVTVPEGGKVEIEDGNTVITPPVDEDTDPDTITVGGTTVTVPDGESIIVDGEGNVTVPDDSSVNVGGTTVTLPEGGTIKPDGNGGATITPEDGTIIVGGNTVTIPDDSSITVDANGNVTVPDDSTVKIGNTEVTLPNGGTIHKDGSIVPEQTTGKNYGEVIVPNKNGKDSTYQVPNGGSLSIQNGIVHITYKGETLKDADRDGKLDIRITDWTNNPQKATYRKGSNGTLVFECNGFYPLLDHMEVDGKELSSNNYEVREGSTVVTLKNSYLKKLKTGEYTLTFVYTDDTEASCNFYVKSVWSALSDNPKTGDYIMIAVGIMAVSAAALVTLFVIKKKVR